MTKKAYNELLEKHGAEELAASFVFPAGLTKKEQQQTDDALKLALTDARKKMSKEDILKANLLKLRFQIEEYVNNKSFDKRKSFGHFLKAYIDGLNKKRSEFASEIQIKPVELSQYVNNHRIPPKSIMIRLELHSHRIIPATDWYRLLEKVNIHELNSNKALRIEQRQFVIKEAEIA